VTPSEGDGQPVTRASAASRTPFYVKRSLALDVSLLTLPTLPLATRLHLTLQKYRALAHLARGRPATVQLGKGAVSVSDIFDLGTVFSSIVDVGSLAGHIRLASEHPVVIDVGANIGQFCLATKLFWPDAVVTSFEPDPEVAAVLAVNTRHLSDVTTVNVGLGAASGLMPWHPHNRSVLSSFRPRSELFPGGKRLDQPQLLPVQRLDEVVGAMSEIELLKVDVEGFEYEVLAGAAESLKRTRWLLLEVSLLHERGPSNLELFELVRRSTPNARIVTLGRVYGPPAAPECVDVLIDLQGTCAGGG